jgi:hypothetical protein
MPGERRCALSLLTGILSEDKLRKEREERKFVALNTQKMWLLNRYTFI